MSGIENFGLHCYANAVFQCISSSFDVYESMQKHSDMHTIPGKEKHLIFFLYLYKVYTTSIQ